MPLTHEASGTFAIAPTPFHDDGRIDEASIDRLTDFYREAGCNGITVLGIMGEAPKLDGQEAVDVATRFIRRAKDMQIIVGVSAPGFAAMRSLARSVMDAGAAGVMIAPAAAAAHRRPDHHLLQAGGRGDRHRHPLGAAGLSADAHRGDDAAGDPPHRHGQPVLRDAEARGLAGPGEDQRAARLPEGRLAAAAVDPDRQWRRCSSTSRWSAAPTAR